MIGKEVKQKLKLAFLAMLNGQFMLCVCGFPVLFLVCCSRLCLPVTCSGGMVFGFGLDVVEDACTVFSKVSGT